MSYLNSPRLTFAGQFQADPSTVNNDPMHYDNATFEPSYQQYGRGATNGWWNPEGTGNWRFLGCTIMSVTYKDGTTTTDPGVDPIIGVSIMDADSRVAGKIVDLDPCQQTVSQLWGLTIRIVNGEKCLVKGDFEPVAFNDIWWVRSQTLRGSSGASAVYQSVIHGLEWPADPGLQSRYLDELKAESPDALSIKFTVDIYSQDRTSPQFTLGRILGSIGPAKAGEPKHFTPGRQLVCDLDLMMGMYLPVKKNNIYMAYAVVDEAASQVVLDLGNSLVTTGPEGRIAETRGLILAVKKDANYETLGTIDYKEAGWQKTYAGIATIGLSKQQLAWVQEYPLAILDAANPGAALIEEVADCVRADQFVFRMNPAESCTIDFYASRLGKPLAGETVVCTFQDSLINIMGQGSGTPPTSTPDILSFAESMVTDAKGKATLTVTAGDPGNPRGWVDGQVYALWYYLKDQPTANFKITYDAKGNRTITPAQLQGINPTDFISLLVFDSVAAATVANPTWDKDIWPIMQQYANLYPLMSKGIFNLGNKDVVDKNAEILKLVFSKERSDPNYMPVTRDLSGDKQKMILNYLDAVTKAAAPKDDITFRQS